MREKAMRAAIEQARQAASSGELPFGAVVVDPAGEVVAAAFDRVGASGDRTRHAELLAVQAAAITYGPELAGCALVSTCEPCAMCFAAAWTANLSAIEFGLPMARLRAVYPAAMDEVVIDRLELNSLAQRRLEITSGTLEAECWELWRRP